MFFFNIFRPQSSPNAQKENAQWLENLKSNFLAFNSSKIKRNDFPNSALASKMAYGSNKSQ